MRPLRQKQCFPEANDAAQTAAAESGANLMTINIDIVLRRATARAHDLTYRERHIGSNRHPASKDILSFVTKHELTAWPSASEGWLEILIPYPLATFGNFLAK